MQKMILLFGATLLVCSAATQPVKKMLGLGLQKKGEAIVVASKVVGTPVMEVPIYYDDTVAAVNGQPLTGLSTEQVVDLIRNATNDTIQLLIKNNGAEELFAVEKMSVPEIKARKAAIINQMILKDVSLPYKIPYFTNYGFVFEMPNDDYLFADDVEFLPGGLIKRTTKRNRENFGNTETYEEPLYEILFPNLWRLHGDYNFTSFKDLGQTPDGTAYFEGIKTYAKSWGSNKEFVINNKGEVLYSTEDLHALKIHGQFISSATYVGHHVFAVKQADKSRKYALVYKNTTPLTGFDFEDVKFWHGPGAYVLKGKSWKVVAFEEVKGAGEGLWSFKDFETEKWGYVDHRGKVIQKPIYEAAYDFKEGFAAVKQGEEWGFLKRDMTWAIRPQFTSTYGHFSGGLAAVRLVDGKWIYINTSGKQAVPGQYLQAKDYQYNGSYAYVLRTDSVGAAIDNLGNTILEFTESARDLTVNYAAPGLFRVKNKGVEYFKTLAEKTYLEYDFSKPRLANTDDILLERERNLANNKREEERQNRRYRQEQSWSASQSKKPTTNVPQNTSVTCTKCNGAGYVTVIGSKTINGRKYADSKIHYVDEYGIASKNYFTLNCSVCKGKGTVSQ